MPRTLKWELMLIWLSFRFRHFWHVFFPCLDTASSQYSITTWKGRDQHFLMELVQSPSSEVWTCEHPFLGPLELNKMVNFNQRQLLFFFKCRFPGYRRQYTFSRVSWTIRRQSASQCRQDQVTLCHYSNTFSSALLQLVSPRVAVTYKIYRQLTIVPIFKLKSSHPHWLNYCV